MIKFSQESYQAWSLARRKPRSICFEKPPWNPKFPLNKKLPPANESGWTKEDWVSSGFPVTPLPDGFPSMLNENQWDKLVRDLLESDSLSQYHRCTLERIKSWLLHGIPYRMSGIGTEPCSGRHILTENETEMAIDKIASFCSQGHMAGPLFSWEDRKDLKFISIFAIDQPSDNSVRIINDHTVPKDRAFNKAIDPNVCKELQIHVGQLRDFIVAVLECGREALMSKYDMAGAYKYIPVTQTQYRLQVIRICGAIFLDMKLTIGDASACHYYSYFHENTQNALVFSAIDTPRDRVTICIDDSSVVVPKLAKDWLTQ